MCFTMCLLSKEAGGGVRTVLVWFLFLFMIPLFIHRKTLVAGVWQLFKVMLNPTQTSTSCGWSDL